MIRTLLIGLFSLATGIAAFAQTLEPRFYSNAPTGLNFLVGGLVYSTGGAALDPSTNLENADLDIYTTVLGYARSFGLFGNSAKFDIAVPYSYLEGSAYDNGTYVSREVAGFGDPAIRFSYNFYGAPALTLEEFKDYSQKWVMGASFKMGVPVGQYDTSRLVNIGTHRWSFTPELGISRRIGRCLLETAGAVTFFTDNNDYAAGKREQAPLYSIQAHAVYLFRNKVWVAVGGTRYTGGRTTVNGVQNSDLIQSSRLGATLAIPVTRHNSLKMYASTGVALRTGTDFDIYGIAWQYRWGGGL